MEKTDISADSWNDWKYDNKIIHRIGRERKDWQQRYEKLLERYDIVNGVILKSNGHCNVMCDHVEKRY